MYTRICFLLLVSLLFISGGCKKYLDKKSNQNLAVPDNLEDLELLLKNDGVLNVAYQAGNAGADEYYLNSNDWESADEVNRDMYVWNPATEANGDWSRLYNAVFVLNTVLDNIQKINRNIDPYKWDELKGLALFFRGYHLYQLAQVYAPPYPGNENSELGLPLRMNADFNQPVTRSTLKATYDQIFEDINGALTLLPVRSAHPMIPSRWAAHAFLSRLYLLVENFQKAYDHSDSTLAVSANLLDYNMVDETPEFPFNHSNPEVIFSVVTDVPVNAYYWVARIDSNLYRSFVAEDLRKKLFFIDNGDGTHSFKGNYTNTYFLFNGLATDEIFLIKAETAVRLDKVEESLEALNTLLRSRWKSGEYENITIADEEVLLSLILEERKKEMIFRGTRWSDLRRLNRDPRFVTTLKRIINGQEYILPPGDPRYLFLIPRESVDRSGLTQNPR